MQVPQHLYEELAREGEKAVFELNLRFGGVTRLPGRLRFDNMIGTIGTRRAVLEVVPKTRPDQDWMRSVLDLMDDRPVSITDDVPASEDRPRSTFLEMIARTYALRLSNALALEGPITTIETVFERASMLNGRLRIEDWLVKSAWEGHRFPLDRQLLTPDNPFCQTLTYVGLLLAPAVADPRLRRDLLACMDTLTSGQEVHAPAPNAVGLMLPEQWGGYEPAWAIAQLILKQKAPFGSRALLHGMSLVIEPWVLLERLLERTVDTFAKAMGSEGLTFSAHRQSGAAFLAGTIDKDARRLLPDCMLKRGGHAIVNFEAKYRNYTETNGPRREESYQAITAGRALGTSLAVLVYPNAMTPKVFDVIEAGHSPDRLAVLGLDMFSYRRGVGEETRASRIRELLENVGGTSMLAVEGASA